MHESLLKFKPYVEKNLVREVISPCGRLVLYNYTDHCTYERAWDEITLNARGTVYEIETGRIVAKAFPKFFNYGELDEKKQKEVLAAKNFECFEKMDGSLGIVYYYDGKWRVNTRGSFTSDQAVKGKEILDRFIMDEFPTNIVLLVEIIYPENKIIVDYGDKESLTVLAAYNLDFNKKEEIIHTVFDYAALETRGFDVVPKEKFSSIQELMKHLKTLDHTEEGYVIRLANGYRVKFKSAEYLRVARIINHMTPLAMWKAMEEGKVKVDYLEHLPEEFREEADKLVADIELKYQAKGLEIANIAAKVFEEVGTDRKEIGMYCGKNKINHGYVFSILDNKKNVMDKIIMKEIRPLGNQL